MDRKLMLFSDECQKNFSELPPLKADESGRSWSFSSGGRGLRDGEWAINVFRGDITDIYPLPEALNTMINMVHRWGKEEAQKAIKAALGL